MLQKRLMLVIGLLVAFSMVLIRLRLLLQQLRNRPLRPTLQRRQQPKPPPRPRRRPAMAAGWMRSIILLSARLCHLAGSGRRDRSVFFQPGFDRNWKPSRLQGVSYSQSYGGYYDIMFNPAVFKDTTVLNPFSDRKIREAMNWAIDRNYHQPGNLRRRFTAQILCHHHQPGGLHRRG